jgi:hypothetical protein
MNSSISLDSSQPTQPADGSHTAVSDRVEPIDPVDAIEQSAIRDSLSEAKQNKRPRRGWLFWLVVAMFFLVVAAIVTVVYWAAASVSGLEINDVTRQVRRFQLLRDPFTDTQLTNIEHDSSGEFSPDAAIAKHIGGGPNRPNVPRWDLININRGIAFGKGEARILLEYLQANDASGNKFWVEWTTANPASAPLLWGAVRDAVHLGRYDWLPKIFDAARVHKDPAALKTALAEVMLALAIDEVKSKSAPGEESAVRRAAVMGLTYGDSPTLKAIVDSAP